MSAGAVVRRPRAAGTSGPAAASRETSAARAERSVAGARRKVSPRSERRLSRMSSVCPKPVISRPKFLRSPAISPTTRSPLSISRPRARLSAANWSSSSPVRSSDGGSAASTAARLRPRPTTAAPCSLRNAFSASRVSRSSASTTSSRRVETEARSAGMIVPLSTGREASPRSISTKRSPKNPSVSTMARALAPMGATSGSSRSSATARSLSLSSSFVTRPAGRAGDADVRALAQAAGVGHLDLDEVAVVVAAPDDDADHDRGGDQQTHGDAPDHRVTSGSLFGSSES